MEPISIVAVALIVGLTAFALLRKALLSLVYAIAILGIYALEVASSPFGLVFLSPITLDLGLVLGLGFPAPWTWMTFEFVHGSETHVFFNLLGLLLISPTFEERVGSLRWALLFFVGGAAGALVFGLVNPGARTILVGASAGLFSAFGGYGRLYPRDRVTLFIPLPRMPTIPVIQLVVLFLILEATLSFIGPRGIAWEAHAGALAFGFAAAPVVMRLPLPGGKARRVRSVEGLRALAVTPELMRILEEAERADLGELQEAWIEKFVGSARCPRCGGPLRLWFGRMTSECGWRHAI